MRIVADLHIHSPYSRVVSREMMLENMEMWTRLKGITVIATGDFTHLAWIKEIKIKLEPVKTNYGGSTSIISIGHANFPALPRRPKNCISCVHGVENQ